ncbi:class I SAM-dependent methyltransferase [Thermodesulfobacteriota bacterium]
MSVNNIEPKPEPGCGEMWIDDYISDRLGQREKAFKELHTAIEAAKRPQVYTPGTARMWTDEYISEQLLEVHLNPDIELASRKGTTIDNTVDWILEKVPGEGLKILDLGCGPGLYAEKLAEKGHRVTGVDFSAGSIGYARGSAHLKKLDINYRQQNYLELEDENSYDLVMMIFTDFGVLMPEERKELLANVRRALKPGGRFLFDVMNENYPVQEAGSKSWEAAEKGFWREGPYIALTESFYYQEEKVTLTQHLVVDENEEAEIYRFWIHTFSHIDLEGLLFSNGFRTAECYDRLIPGCDMYRSEDVTFCIATK